MSEPDYLVIEIHGRQAVPVRAIPYITGWILKPGTLAALFARSEKPVHSKLGTITTYRLIRGKPSAILPKEWDAVEVRLAAFKAELYDRYPYQVEDEGDVQHNRGYALWRAESASCLPAGVFVWRDEFEACFKEDLSRRAHSFLEDERAGERDLIYNPLPSETPQKIILEGFPETTAETKRSATAPTSLAVGSEPAMPQGISKQQVITAFADLHFDEKQWAKYLATPAPWLRACRIQRGSKSRIKQPTLWNPVLIAVALTEHRRRVPLSRLDGVFARHKFLAEWSSQWFDKSEIFR